MNSNVLMLPQFLCLLVGRGEAGNWDGGMLYVVLDKHIVVIQSK